MSLKDQQELLKFIDEEIKKREESIGLQEEMLAKLQETGASAEEIAAAEEKINKAKALGNSLAEKRVQLEEEITATIEKQELNMTRLSVIGGLFMKGLEKTQDLLKLNSDTVNMMAGEMNMNVKEAQALNVEIGQHLVDGRQDLTNREEVVKAMAAFKNESIAGRDISAETAVNMAIQTKQLGIAVDEAASFADLMFTTEGATAETSMQFMNGLKHLSEMSGVKFDKVAKDIATHGKAIAANFGLGAKEIGIMAVEARKLGFELGDVEGMSKQLLDTEGRIEKQMTLNTVLQRNMNFDKAAQLMAEGNISGAMEEYKKQLGDTTKLSAYQRQLVQEQLGINLYNLENAEAIKKEKEETAAKEQELADMKMSLLELQLEEFDLKATEREEAATAADQAANRDAERNQKMADFIVMSTDANNLAQTLQYIQLGIQGALAASAIAGQLLSKSQKDTLRSSIATLPKLAAAAISRGVSAVAALTTNAAATFGIGTAIALAAAAAGTIWMYAEQRKAKSAAPTGDLGIDPNGGPIVMSPTEGGIFQGTKGDGLSMGPGFGTKGGGGDMGALIKKMDELISAVKQNRVLSVDGFQLNEATHLEKIPSGMV